MYSIGIDLSDQCKADIAFMKAFWMNKTKADSLKPFSVAKVIELTMAEAVARLEQSARKGSQ